MNTTSTKQRATVRQGIVALISVVVSCALVFALTPAYALEPAASAEMVEATIAAVSAEKAVSSSSASSAATREAPTSDASGEPTGESASDEAVDAHDGPEIGTITIGFDFGSSFAGTTVPMVFAKPSEWEPYLDGSSATAVFDAVGDANGCGSISIPKTVFSTGAPIDDLSGYHLFLLSFKNNGRIEHQNNPGRFDQNWFEPKAPGSIYGFQHRFTTIDQGNDRYQAQLVPIGTAPLAAGEVLNLLGDCTRFAVVADSLEIKGDMEGNLATKNLSGHGEIGITSAVTEAVNEVEIQVYVESEEEEGELIMLTLSNANTGEVVEHVELEADAWGCAEYVFRISRSAFTSADVYRISTAGEDAEIITPDLGVEPEAIMATANINYAKHIDCTMLNGKNPVSDHIVTTEDTYPGRSLTLETVTEDEFDEIIDIDWMLDNAAHLSKRLAQATSGNGYAVYYLSADQLTGGKRLSIDYDESDSAIINVTVPSSTARFTISPDTLMLGSHNLSDGQTWDSFASKVLWNFVDEHGAPYQGVVATSRTIKGTFLVPQGTFNPDSSSPALIVANTVIQGNGEFHKVPFGRSSTASYSMTVYPEGSSDFEIDDEWPPLSPFPPGISGGGDGGEDPVDPDLPDTGDDDAEPAEPTVDIQIEVPDEDDYGLYIDEELAECTTATKGSAMFREVPVAETFEYFVKNESTGSASETFRIREAGEDLFSFEYADEAPEMFRTTLFMAFSPRATAPDTDPEDATDPDGSGGSDGSDSSGDHDGSNGSSGSDGSDGSNSSNGSNGPDGPAQPNLPTDPGDSGDTGTTPDNENDQDGSDGSQAPADPDDPQDADSSDDSRAPDDPDGAADPDEPGADEADGSDDPDGSGNPTIGPSTLASVPVEQMKAAARTIEAGGSLRGAEGKHLSQTNDDARAVVALSLMALTAAMAAGAAGIRRLRCARKNGLSQKE